MASQTRKVLVCDKCDREDSADRPVKTHTLVVDGARAKGEACERCWSDGLAGIAFLGDAIAAARKIDVIVCLDCRPRKRFDSKRALGQHRRHEHSQEATG